jgi:hypothetical protein
MAVMSSTRMVTFTTNGSQYFRLAWNRAMAPNRSRISGLLREEIRRLGRKKQMKIPFCGES